jgi:magnesium chelatase family protein
MGESSENIKDRVEKARRIQRLRYKDYGIYCNAQLTPSLIKKHCVLEDKCKSLIERIFVKYSLTTRAYSRILKVARTIADLKERTEILQEDVFEAIQYRKFLNENII